MFFDTLERLICFPFLLWSDCYNIDSKHSPQRYCTGRWLLCKSQGLLSETNLVVPRWKPKRREWKPFLYIICDDLHHRCWSHSPKQLHLATPRGKMNELLRLTEQISKGYGLGLFWGCVFGEWNKQSREYWARSLEKNVWWCKTVRRTWFKLHPYWKASQASKKCKLIIFDAIFGSKHFYGLETVHPTEAVSESLAAFHMRGLQTFPQPTPNFRRPSLY